MSLFFAAQSPAFAAGPAARLGDIISHGGTIFQGESKVLIGGKPVARAGDIVTCLQVGIIDGAPTPHVGGPIITGNPTV